MSNFLAIAAVTATLRNLLDRAFSADPDLAGTSVTALPPDKARDGGLANQVNVFLYHTVPNAAWRNMDMPLQVKPGEKALPPLALNLYYIVTAYGQNNDDLFAHKLLGRAMSVLHDHSILSRAEIEAALPGSALSKQVDSVRITPETLSSEEMYKLWSAFQTNYRISAAYQAAVVLIESTQPVKASLPVLSRGKNDFGPRAGTGLIPPFPGLDQVLPPNNQPSARLGDPLTISGHDLDGTNVGVQFDHPLFANPVEIAPGAGATAESATVQIPADKPAQWPAGFYTVAVLVQRPGDTFRRSTNQLSFSLAPRIVQIKQRPAGGGVTLTITCSPEVAPDQRAVLLFDDQEIASQPHTATAGTLHFSINSPKPGDYFVRLRVDGVDSLLVDRSASPPRFDDTQKVTIA